jgi:acetoin:2,6-dichlorophenolindophenol oxidoreductase subunit beta
MPKMKFGEAIRDATFELMRSNPDVFLVGVGLVDPKAVFATIAGALDEFGHDRVIEGPLAEQMLTGMAFSAATLGLRPILIHHRMDFTLLTMDQIVNHLAKWKYMFPQTYKVPIVIRGIVGRGWGNGPQHTQSLHGLFAGVPGLKVVVPSCASDAKGLLISSVLGEDPVIFIEHRWLHADAEEVPSGLYEVPIGKAKIVKEGTDLTLVAVGPMVQEAMIAQKALQAAGKSIEVIDLRTIRPIDFETILKSVQKTGHLVVTDSDWPHAGVAASVVSEMVQKAFHHLKAPPATVTWPDHPVPSSYGIDPLYYPMAKELIQTINNVFGQEAEFTGSKTEKDLYGPF